MKFKNDDYLDLITAFNWNDADSDEDWCHQRLSLIRVFTPDTWIEPTLLVIFICAHFVNTIDAVSNCSIEVRSLQKCQIIPQSYITFEYFVPDLKWDNHWCIAWCKSQTLTRFWGTARWNRIMFSMSLELHRNKWSYLQTWSTSWLAAGKT